MKRFSTKRSEDKDDENKDRRKRAKDDSDDAHSDYSEPDPYVDVATHPDYREGQPHMTNVKQKCDLLSIIDSGLTLEEVRTFDAIDFHACGVGIDFQIQSVKRFKQQQAEAMTPLSIDTVSSHTNNTSNNTSTHNIAKYGPAQPPSYTRTHTHGGTTTVDHTQSQNPTDQSQNQNTIDHTQNHNSSTVTKNQDQTPTNHVLYNTTDHTQNHNSSTVTKNQDHTPTNHVLYNATDHTQNHNPSTVTTHLVQIPTNHVHHTPQRFAFRQYNTLEDSPPPQYGSPPQQYSFPPPPAPAPQLPTPATSAATERAGSNDVTSNNRENVVGASGGEF